MWVSEFNRIFDGNNVSLTLLIAIIGQRGHRGGLTRTGTADK